MTGIRAFVLFMLFYFPGVPVMPVTDEHLADFVCFLSEAIAPQSIKIYIYGVRAFHLCHGFAFQAWAQRFPVWRAMQGVKRIYGTMTTSGYPGVHSSTTIYDP